MQRTECEVTPERSDIVHYAPRVAALVKQFMNMEQQRRRLCCCALVAAACAACRAPGAADIYVMPYDVDPPLVIDGRLDDWENVPNAVELRGRQHVTYMPQTWQGPADLSGTVRVAWRNGISLAAEVTDDTFQQPYTGARIHSGDHLNLWLDLDPTREPDRTVFGKGQHHVAFSPGNLAENQPTPPEIVVYLPTGAETSGGLVAARRTGGGYVL